MSLFSTQDISYVLYEWQLPALNHFWSVFQHETGITHIIGRFKVVFYIYNILQLLNFSLTETTFVVQYIDASKNMNAECSVYAAAR